MFLRIPAWSKESTVTVDGKKVENVIPGLYLGASPPLERGRQRRVESRYAYTVDRGEPFGC